NRIRHLQNQTAVLQEVNKLCKSALQAKGETYSPPDVGLEACAGGGGSAGSSSSSDSGSSTTGGMSASATATSTSSSSSSSSSSTNEEEDGSSGESGEFIFLIFPVPLQQTGSLGSLVNASLQRSSHPVLVQIFLLAPSFAALQRLKRLKSSLNSSRVQQNHLLQLPIRLLRQPPQFRPIVRHTIRGMEEILKPIPIDPFVPFIQQLILSLGIQILPFLPLPQLLNRIADRVPILARLHHREPADPHAFQLNQGIAALPHDPRRA
ncbi:hypothetical protein D0859_16435, partial [Hortaea werneckii]